MNLQANLFSATGEAKGKIDLPENLAGDASSRRVLHEVIVALQANQRRGTSNTKSRGEVSGGGHKPWKQKGTGNARSGSNRSPLWRKGGIIFGPHPRSYRIDIDAAKKRTALLTAVAEKAKVEGVSVIESLKFEQPKTRDAQGVFKKLGSARRTLVIVEKRDDVTSRAMRNLDGVALMDAQEVNAWHVLGSKQVLFTQAALQLLTDRISQG